MAIIEGQKPWYRRKTFWSSLAAGCLFAASRVQPEYGAILAAAAALAAAIAGVSLREAVEKNR